MRDIIRKENREKFIGLAKELINKDQHSPINIIKSIRIKENCSLAEAKEVYVLSENNESLGSIKKE